MNLRRVIHLLLAVCVSFGLAWGPVVTPVAAAAMAPAIAMTGMDHGMAMPTDAMPADMPCCPSEPSSQDCPLMALCMLKTAQATPSLAHAMMVRQAARASHPYRNDALADGVDRPPPDHPPRA